MASLASHIPNRNEQKVSYYGFYSNVWWGKRKKDRPVGGINEAATILERFVKEKKCDIKKLIEYTLQFPAVKTRKCIGVSLEAVGISETLLKTLEKSVKYKSLISFSNNRKGKINNKMK